MKIRSGSLGRLAGVAILASLLPTLPSLADDRPEITVAVQQIVNSGALDVLRERSNVGGRIFYSFYEGLIDFERQNLELPLKPGLAESWKQVDDKTVELKLRPNVKFHDGDVMTADDVVFTFSPERFGTLDAQQEARKEGRTLFAGSVSQVPARCRRPKSRPWPCAPGRTSTGSRRSTT